MEFRIWYADGAVANGTTFGGWKRAPREGVLGIATRIDRPYPGQPWRGVWATGGDWYWFLETGPVSGDSHPRRNRWIPYDGPGDEDDAKWGVWAPKAQFAQVEAAMRRYLGIGGQ